MTEFDPKVVAKLIYIEADIERCLYGAYPEAGMIGARKGLQNTLHSFKHGNLPGEIYENCEVKRLMIVRMSDDYVPANDEVLEEYSYEQVLSENFALQQ